MKRYSFLWLLLVVTDAWLAQRPLFLPHSSSGRRLATPHTEDFTTTHDNGTPSKQQQQQQFDLDTALFLGGLAFDAYVEPPQDSSRWERGSKGWRVAFLSPRFTRHLYKGLLKLTVQRIYGLPADPDNSNGVVEQVLTGRGVDACLLVAVVEGSWQEDVKRLEKEQFHAGVLDLTGAAHVGRTSTAWSNVDQATSERGKKRGKAVPYHVPATWGKGGEAVWPELSAVTQKGEDGEAYSFRSNSFYLYVQDPATARLVFTVLDDDRIGGGDAIGSTFKPLKELIPQAAASPEQWLKGWKEQILSAGGNGTSDMTQVDSKSLQASWEGELKLTSKPPKQDKNSQIFAGAAAGAMLAGPAGAAVGALAGRFYESQVQGRIACKINFLPILPQQQQQELGSAYQVLGGMPGINWGQLFRVYREKNEEEEPSDEFFISSKLASMKDLEHCFFVNHETTGATCAVYRSLEEKLVIVSFRGTCAPVDLLTDTNLLQEAWKEGEDVKEKNVVKVHAGFRTSLNSISRRLKELILATPAPGDDIQNYDMLVTGHSLGGALATLFVADVGEYGIDAGRGLPQTQESDAWWKSIASLWEGNNSQKPTKRSDPPRPKSLHLYNFGSPRVGNDLFCSNFDSLVENGRINSAYRIVNGDDVVARLPRTMNALVLGNVGYEHVGSTVLVAPSNSTDAAENSFPLMWIEGESDDRACPVRDSQTATASPMAEGSLLKDLLDATKMTAEDEAKAERLSGWSWDTLTAAASKVTERMKKVSASDLASILGIDREFTDRELRLINSVLEGKAIAHHMEDEYYASMARAANLRARVGEEISVLDS